MKKQLVAVLITMLYFNSYSQITFEKGYFIDNNDLKTHCLIKNIDWENNPTEFEYQLSENSEVKKETIKSVKEFGVDHNSKYVRHSVNIDRSSENHNFLSDKKESIFNEEELFLKVLVEGKANLYEYIDVNLRRYFYSIENSTIEQLVFKSFITKENKIGKNTRFRQQLWNGLKCQNFKLSKIESLDYKKNDLVPFFVEYSECKNNDLINYEPKQKRDLLNLTVRPRLKSSSLTIPNYYSSIPENINFGKSIGVGLGLEFEYILPFNKNKWALAVEPTYQEFKSEKTTDVPNVTGGKLLAVADYSSIEIPISIRHYFFLKNNSKIFVNASYVHNIGLKSSLKFKRTDNSSIDSLEIESLVNLAFGIGYKLDDRYSLETRYQTNREFLVPNYSLGSSDYKTLSFIIGYSFF